jgi:hypothetical protein
MATILYYRRSGKTQKYMPEYIVISDTLPEHLTKEELDNWCDTGYKLYSKHKLEGDVVQLPCDTILVPESRHNEHSSQNGKRVMSNAGFLSNLLR